MGWALLDGKISVLLQYGVVYHVVCCLLLFYVMCCVLNYVVCCLLCYVMRYDISFHPSLMASHVSG